MNAQPAGWYADPHDASQLRYWSGNAWTEHRSPRGQAPTAAYIAQKAPAPQVATGKWYFVVTIATVGLLAALPFFHAASRLDRPELRKVGAGMAAGGLLGYALIAVSPTDNADQPTGWLSNVAVLILLAVVLVATLLLIGIRREVYQPSAPVQPNGNQGAMTGIEEARRKRNEARKLAARDPMMARDLGIGASGVAAGIRRRWPAGPELCNGTAVERGVWPTARRCGEGRGVARQLGAFPECGGHNGVWTDRRGVRAPGPRPWNHHRGPTT